MDHFFSRRLSAFCLLAGATLMACSSQAPRTSHDANAEGRSGSAIARSVRGLDLEAREAILFDEIARGNVPSWADDFRPVTIKRSVEGVEHTVTFRVTPDYLSVGTDDDPFLVPLTPQTSQRVANLWGASLPTTLMVDAIWENADVRLEPQPIPPSDRMTTVHVFEDHNRMVQEQKRLAVGSLGLGGAGSSPIVSGHKKDVVLTQRLADAPGKVAIYGWHRLSGEPIQPLYTGHTDRWVDYSHGIRLVHRTVVIDGAERDLLEVLADSALAPLLSGEGVIVRSLDRWNR